MEMIRKIMVAVDFSDFSLMSLRYSAALAKDAGASLLLANVINQRDLEITKKVAKQYSSFSAEKHLEETLEDRKKRFKELLARIDVEGVTVDAVVQTGVPYEELLKLIDEKGPDLLVMATKGRSNLMDTLVGSCARRMFRHSKIPVLSIRAK